MVIIKYASQMLLACRERIFNGQWTHMFSRTEQGSLVRTRESSRIFLFLSLLPPVNVNYYSFVWTIATLVHINLQRTWKSSRSPGERFIRVIRSSSGGKKGPDRSICLNRQHSRLLLSTRPCVSHAAAFVVVVIVSSRVMGRFFPSGAATSEEAAWRWKRR